MTAALSGMYPPSANNRKMYVLPCCSIVFSLCFSRKHIVFTIKHMEKGKNIPRLPGEKPQISTNRHPKDHIFDQFQCKIVKCIGYFPSKVSNFPFSVCTLYKYNCFFIRKMSQFNHCFFVANDYNKNCQGDVIKLKIPVQFPLF